MLESIVEVMVAIQTLQDYKKNKKVDAIADESR